MDHYHGNAVFNSVYNVLHGMPYDELCNSIYGNYALFFYLPMKILGNGEYFDFSRLMCGLTMLCIALAIFVIHNLVKREDIKYLCVCVLPFHMCFALSNYWQTWPLRVLWPITVLAWLTALIYIRNTQGKFWLLVYKYRHLISWGILTAAFLWNKESGVVCFMGWCTFCFCENFLGNRNLKKLCLVIVQCLFMSTSIVAAFCIVGMYNLIVSGKWITWEIFLFPLGEGSYMEALQVGLKRGIWPWMINTILFLITFSVSALKVSLNSQRAEWKMYATTATIGLGLMIYFVNRPAYFNMDLCFFQSIICMGGMASMRENSQNWITPLKTVRWFTMLILVALFWGNIIQGFDTTQLKFEKGSFYRGDILALKDSIEREIPKYTYAFGVNIPELYSLLGWNTGSMMIDWPDAGIIHDKVEEKILRDLEVEELVLTDKEVLGGRVQVNDKIRNMIESNYDLIKTYYYNENVEFYLWKRK